MSVVRRTSLLLILLLLASTAVCLTGCGNGGESSSSTNEGDIGIENKTLLDTPEVVETAKEGASNAARQANLQMLDSAIQAYYMSEGVYPTTVQQLVPNYMRSVPTDPAGGTYYIANEGGVAKAAVR